MTQVERVELAQRIGTLTRTQNHAVSLRQSRSEARIRRLQSIERGTSRHEVINIHEHMLRIEEAIGVTEEEIQTAEEEVEKARQKLVTRRRDERAIELHRERRWKTWLKDYYRDENRTLDDLAIMRHVRISE